MTNFKIVTGANYGDEGKGLMTDFFAAEAIARGEKCIVVCHNGGAQRGHTVVTPNGFRHVFHHFGSGTFAGADTYFSEEFILNPILFCKEFFRLSTIGIIPKCYVHPNCRVTLPYDMIINQLVESDRGNNKHGSCGVGILETILRNNKKPLTISNIIDNLSDLDLIMDAVRKQYLPRRLGELGINSLPMSDLKVIYSDTLIKNYMVDVLQMLSLLELADNDILTRYDTVIFEGGQGLLLDQNRIEGMPHLTPSNTGIQNPMRIIGSLPYGKVGEIEACYVSRTYMTKHGAGEFPTECDKSEINPDMFDMTNIPNEFQGEIRYGKLILFDLIDRIAKDVGTNKVKATVAFTHTNELNLRLEPSFLYDYYLSDSQTRNSVKRAKKEPTLVGSN